MRPVALLGLTIGSSVLAACSEALSPQACIGARIEFAVTGCGRVAGQVVNSAGQAQPNIRIGYGAPTDPARGGFSAVEPITDADGGFVVALTRYSGPSVIPSPDTVTIGIAALSPTAGPPLVLQQVLVQMAPVGAVPDTVYVQLRLP
jgi:hypothetical protein